MNHDVSHCSDYIPDKCPLTCYRAVVTKDLRDNLDKFGDIPMSYAHFKGTIYCKFWPKKEKKT